MVCQRVPSSQLGKRQKAGLTMFGEYARSLSTLGQTSADEVDLVVCQILSRGKKRQEDGQ